MRLTIMSVSLCAAFSIAAIAAEGSNWLGTWKLNPLKSSFEGVPVTKEETVTFKKDGANTMRQASGTDVDGKTLAGDNHNESFPWDGKFHVVSTAQDGDGKVEVGVKVVDANHLTATIRMNGKLHSTSHSTLSADGKTDTEVEDGVTQDGKKFHKVSIYEKQ